MDPLSVSAGVAGFISLGLEVTKLLVQFYKDYAGQAADLSHTTRRLTVLSATLGGLKSHLDNRKFHDGEQELVTVVEEATGICNDYIDELRHHLAKFERHETGTIWSKTGASTRRLAYPFRKSTLEKLDRDISEASSSAAFALQVLQEGIMTRTYDEIEQIGERLGIVCDMTEKSNISGWLQAPDPSAAYNDTRRRKQSGTGLWFVQGQAFASWLSAPNSFLWVYGFAGTGKSVLCSTAIQHAHRHRQANQRVGLAFYFFSFTHSDGQTVSKMLRSLVLQLSNQRDFTLLEKLHGQYKNATPPNEALLSCLQRLLQSFENVYVFLDALDECAGDNSGSCDQWDELYETINLIRGWTIPGLHMLTTSRDDPEIRDALCPSTEESISMKNPAVNSDIALFIDTQLKSRKRLRKWSESHELIKSELLRRADGVFRWVECQFTSLEKCLTLRQLRGTLSKLPPTLGETYERILGNVPDEYVEFTRRVLNILCCAVRELSVEEVRLAAAVEIGNDNAQLDPDDMLNENVIFSLCPGFIENPDRRNDDPGRTPMRIAHASVREYLESDDVGRWNARVTQFRLRKSAAHADMACICLAVGLSVPEETAAEGQGETDFGKALSRWLNPLSTWTYFATHWPAHYRRITTPSSRKLPELLASRLFVVQGAPRDWVTLGCLEDPFYKAPDSLLYFAALLGLDFLVSTLADDMNWRQDCSTSSSDFLNMSKGPYGSALQAAAAQGHESIVRLLLDRGADVDVEGGKYGTALQQATRGEHSGTVSLLLARGAKVNTPASYYGTALQVAARRGNGDILHILLTAGADVNAPPGEYGTALQAAAGGGHVDIVQLLLDHRAEINAWDYCLGTALQTAAVEGYVDVVELLLDNGADATAKTGMSLHTHRRLPPSPTRSPLGMQFLSRQTQEGPCLAGSGENITTSGGRLRRCRDRRSPTGKEILIRGMMRDLYTHGSADCNFTALHGAAANGHAAVASILIKHGADINAIHNEGTALQLAIDRGHNDVVELLLKHGADANLWERAIRGETDSEDVTWFYVQL